MGDIGFVTHHHFESGSAELALWGFSRGIMRGCSSYGFPGAAGNGAGASGLRAYSSDCLLHSRGSEHSGDSSLLSLHLCRKQILTPEELNTLKH